MVNGQEWTELRSSRDSGYYLHTTASQHRWARVLDSTQNWVGMLPTMRNARAAGRKCGEGSKGGALASLINSGIECGGPPSWFQ